MAGPTRDDRLPSWLAIGVACVVTVVWTVTYLADVFNPDFNPSPAVNAIFLVVLSAIFGVEFVRRTRVNGKDRAP